MSIPAKGYVVAQDYEYLYPGAGDPTPPGGATVHLLGKGGVCIKGKWGDPFFIGWAPLPRRNREKEEKL